MDKPLRANEGLYDAFLNDALEHDEQVEHTLSGLLASAPPLQPCAALRARILAGARRERRLAAHADAAARLLDVEVERARELLELALCPASFREGLPGIEFCWLPGGPKVAAAVRGFVRVRAGLAFPHHEHLGEESLLVLQGSIQDDARGLRFGPGELDVLPAGSAHAFHVPTAGPDLLGLAVTQVGMRVLGLTLRGGRAITPSWTSAPRAQVER